VMGFNDGTLYSVEGYCHFPMEYDGVAWIPMNPKLKN